MPSWLADAVDQVVGPRRRHVVATALGYPKEVLEARLFSPAGLPDGMPEAHRELAASL